MITLLPASCASAVAVCDDTSGSGITDPIGIVGAVLVAAAIVAVVVAMVLRTTRRRPPE